MTASLFLSRSCLRGASLAAAAACACFLPVVATAQTRANLDVSAGATAASNPHLQSGSSTAAVGANLTIEPSLVVETGDSSIDFRGSLGFEKFFDKYALDDSIQLAAAGERRINERTTLTADVDFRSSTSAARRFYAGADVGDLGPDEFPDSPQIDPTLANLAGRTSRLGVNGSVRHLLGPRSSLTASAGLGFTRVSSASGRDYRDSNMGLEYTRSVNETTSAVITVNGGYADYLGRRDGDGWFVTSLAGVDHQISRALHVSAQLGASVVAIETPAGDRQTTAVWAGKLDLCDQEDRGSVCLTGARTTQPTSIGGLSTVSSVGVSYARSFGSRESASAAASYARTSQAKLSSLIGRASRSELVNVSGTYRRKIGARVAAFVTPSFTSIKDEIIGRRENYQALLGVSYNFGNAR